MPHTIMMDKAVQLGVYFMRILEKLKKLGDENHEQLTSKSNIEKYVQDEIFALLDAEASFREVFISFMEVALSDVETLGVPHGRTYQFSGSVVEGAIMARCFHKKEDWREIEMDLMHNLFDIPQETSHLLESVDNKPGFVRLPYCKELCSETFYTVYALELLVGNKINFPHSLYQKLTYISPLVIRNTWKEDHDRHWAIPNTKYRKTETTVEAILDLRRNDGSVIHISTDIVPAVCLLFWPHQAKAWITHHRRWWPQQDTIQNIVDKGCQVVPRSSPGGDVHSEWRLSFSGPEVILAQLRSQKQQQAYYFFKMFFYRYLKCVESSEPEGKQLYSYIIKTTMLWAYEDLPPEDPIWTSLETSVQFLLFKLLSSLQAGFLSHYFIPEINLLERVNEDVRIKCIEIIGKYQNNILMSAPCDMPEKREFLNEIHSLYLKNLRWDFKRSKACEVLRQHFSHIISQQEKTHWRELVRMLESCVS